MRRNELLGFKNGMLTVLYKACSIKDRSLRWVCQCDCGNQIVLESYNVKRIKSCRCVANKKFKDMATKHGLSNTAEHNVWRCMISRCYNVKNGGFQDYGGRGIKICERWLNSFENFYEDMGKRPSKKHSIDRINNDGNYESSNCRWATRKEQANNKRSNTVIVINGESKTLSQWAELIGVSNNVMYARNKNLIDKTKLLKPLKKKKHERTKSQL